MLSDLRYLKEGIPFLGPGEKIRCLWDRLDRLVPYLDEKGLNEGIAVRVSYKDLTGEAYATEWRINPLLYEGLRYDANRLAPGPSEPGIPTSKVADEHGNRGRRRTHLREETPHEAQHRLRTVRGSAGSSGEIQRGLRVISAW